MQNLIIPPEEVCLITLHCYLGTSVFAKIDVFFLEKVQMAFDPTPHFLHCVFFAKVRKYALICVNFQ